MLSVDFDQLTIDVQTIGLNVYRVDYGKIPWPIEKAQPLHDAILRERYQKLGLSGEELELFCKQDRTWEEMNTGKIFNFWHFCYNLMESTMVTTSNYHFGKCVIKRGMVDPQEKEDPVKLLLLPTTVTAGYYSAPIINAVLDFYKVDEMEITTKVGR
jgi:hypothetical protein